MILKIQIRTPKDCANRTAKLLKPFILGVRRMKNETVVNQEGSLLTWTVECGERDACRIRRNVTRFDWLVKSIFTDKRIKKKILPLLEPGQLEELEDMLTKHTKVTIESL